MREIIWVVIISILSVSIGVLSQQKSTSISFYDQVPIGTVLPFAGSNISNLGDKYMICDGKDLSEKEYSELFNAIGDTFSESKYKSDSNSTRRFNLPDLRGKVIVGTEENKRQLGTKFGNETHTLTIEQLPKHNHGGGNHSHTYIDNGHVHEVKGGNANTTIAPLKGDGGGDDGSYAFTDVLQRSESQIFSARNSKISIAIESASNIILSQGNGQSFELSQPSIVLNYIIKVK